MQPRRRTGSRDVRRLLLAATAALALVAASVAEATFPGRNGRLAIGHEFECWEHSQIATMDADGTSLRILTGNPCEIAEDVPPEAAPDWSPDGARLILERGRVDPSDLATMRADGSDLTTVPLAPGHARYSPSFSPDGKRFAYVRAPATGLFSPEIWVASTDGREDRRLGAGSLPRWSPDGTRIAFVAPPTYQDGQMVGLGGVWLMSARTGRLIRRLARIDAEALDWSPDGRRLLYSPSNWPPFCCRPRELDLFVLRANGKGSRRVTSTPRLHENGAVWSPDGRQIAFARTRDTSEGEYDVYGHSTYSIWRMTARGKRQRGIWIGPSVDNFVAEGPPTLSWQPRPHRRP